jgi:hypothetical protein
MERGGSFDEPGADEEGDAAAVFVVTVLQAVSKLDFAPARRSLHVQRAVMDGSAWIAT